MTNKKTISNNSSGIQANGNVNLNVGLTFDQVEKLTTFFLKENFPKLREDAMKLAHENVQKLLNEFKKQLEEKIFTINLNNFSDPDVQNSINDAVLETAKRGNKANLDILVDLIFKRVQQTNNDLQSLTASEAIKIISRLNTGQINYLSIMVLFHHMSLKSCANLNNFDLTCSKLLPILKNVNKINGWDIQYLESQRCLVHLFIGHENIIKQLKEKYTGLKDKTEAVLQQEIENSTYFKDFIAIYEKHKMNFTRLSIIGQLIGAINIAKYLPQSIDFDNYIK